jgi:hypothetical protein
MHCTGRCRPAWAGLLRLLLPLVLLTEGALAGAPAPPEVDFIAVEEPIEHVYDPVRQRLYVTTYRGWLERYDLRFGLRLAPIRLPGRPRGFDVTADGRFAWVANQDAHDGLGVLHEVDLATGALRALEIPLEHGYPNADENGLNDVAIAADGVAWVSAGYIGGTGQQCRLRALDLMSGTAIVETDLPGQRSFWTDRLDCGAHLWRSFDRSVVVVGSSSTFIEHADFYRHEVGTDGFTTIASDPGPSVAIAGPGQTSVGADLVATRVLVSYSEPEVVVFDVATTPVASFPGLAAPVFDPTGASLHLLDLATDEVVTVRTSDWAEQSRTPIGEDLEYAGRKSAGEVSISGDGETLFVSTDHGVRLVRLVPEPAAILELAAGAAALAAARRQRRAAAAACAALVVFSAAGAHAATLHVAKVGGTNNVCGSLAEPCPEIGQALEHAADGDTIVVDPGLYGDADGDGFVDWPADEACECIVHVTKRVRIVSSGGADKTYVLAGATGLSPVRIEASGAAFGARNRGFTLVGAPAGKAALAVAAEAAGVRVEGNVAAESGTGFLAQGSGAVLRDNRAEDNLETGFLIGGQSVELLRNAAAGNAIGFQLEGDDTFASLLFAAANGRGLVAIGGGLRVERASISENDAQGIQLLPEARASFDRLDHRGNGAACALENVSGGIVILDRAFLGPTGAADVICDVEGSQTELARPSARPLRSAWLRRIARLLALRRNATHL